MQSTIGEPSLDDGFSGAICPECGQEILHEGTEVRIGPGSRPVTVCDSACRAGYLQGYGDYIADEVCCEVWGQP